MESPTTGLEPSVPKPPGRLTALMMKWLFRQATVTKVETLSPHFRRITLAGEALKAIAWVPGQKIQISVEGNATRTYTPISWNAAAGETQILAFAHGDGVGAAWTSTVQVGAACAFFGPRRSLDLDGAGTARTFLFGDETAFGLALAAGAATNLFEVTSVAEAEQVWRACTTLPARFVARADGDAHLDAVAAETEAAIGADRFILSGKASSIQRVRSVLKGHAVAGTQIRSKAYWAPGKKGLD